MAPVRIPASIAPSERQILAPVAGGGMNDPAGIACCISERGWVWLVMCVYLSAFSGYKPQPIEAPTQDMNMAIMNENKIGEEIHSLIAFTPSE